MANLFTSIPAATRKTLSKPEETQTLTVSSLTRGIRDALETRFADVVVEGEISNFLHHKSGHRYFCLKDSESQISAVFWKSRGINFELKDGLKVFCRGRVTVYPPRGAYQFDVFQIRPAGIGELQKAFEVLYQKLRSEGLFDPTRKRPIPRFPQTVGLVTSETGAALQDILHVFHRRYPLARIVIRHAQVQGVGAELEIARGIQEFNLLTDNIPDVLIVGRGGGSLEDLWAFNEEAVARAIFSSKIPIISAVGHEIDFTIADFVADLRAPTPTAAAELATPDIDELLAGIAGLRRSMDYVVRTKLNYDREALRRVGLADALRRIALRSIREQKNQIGQYRKEIASILAQRLERVRLLLERDGAKLSAMDPRAVLGRGFTILQRLDGAAIASSKEWSPDTEAQLLFADGKIKVQRAS